MAISEDALLDINHGLGVLCVLGGGILHVRLLVFLVVRLFRLCFGRLLVEILHGHVNRRTDDAAFLTRLGRCLDGLRRWQHTLLAQLSRLITVGVQHVVAISLICQFLTLLILSVYSRSCS